MEDYVNESGSIVIGANSLFTQWETMRYSVRVNSSGVQFAISAMASFLRSITVTYAGSSKTFTAETAQDSRPNITVESGTIYFPYVSKVYKVTFTGTTTAGTTLYFKTEDSGSGVSAFTVGPDFINSLPSASVKVPPLYAGKEAKITWSTSDEDGDTVYTMSLIRYLKRTGTVNTESKTLISEKTTITSFTDTIPLDAGGGEVYYYLGFTDGVGATQYKQSSTVTVSTNTAPTEPGTIMVEGEVSGSEVKGGGNLHISWPSSVDTDGNLAGYELEKQENGGNWVNIFTGSPRKFDTIVPEGITTIRYRVRAYDTMGAKSGYTTGIRYTVNNNKAPVITISTAVTGGSIGTFPNAEKETPVLTYTVTDPENTKMTVEEYMDGVLLRRETATGADARMIAFEDDVWIRILNGDHVLRIVAKDADGSVGSAEVRFTKDVDRIEIYLKPDVSRETDTRPSLIMVNVQGLIPEGAILTVEAANNANDSEPVWEDISEQVKSRIAFPFRNDFKAAEKWAVNVHIILERGESESICTITSVGGNWR